MQRRTCSERARRTALTFGLGFLLGCEPFDVLPPNPEPLPPDNPGQLVAGVQDPFDVVSDPSTGRFLVPVYAGNRTFAILTVDPLTRTVDTLVGRSSGVLRWLRIASESGTVFFAADTAPSLPSPSVIYRVLEAGRTELMPTPGPVTGDFVVSPEGTHLLYTSAPAVWTLVDAFTGEQLATRSLSTARALGPAGAEVVVEYPTVQVVSLASGATRALPNATGGYLARAAWASGAFRGITVEPPVGPSRLYTARHWSEGGATSTLGAVSARDVGLSFCVGWNPSSQRAVVMADSMSSAAFFSYYKRLTIAAVESGSAKTIGSANLNGEIPVACALSLDGKVFAYTGSRDFLGPTGLFIKAVE